MYQCEDARSRGEFAERSDNGRKGLQVSIRVSVSAVSGEVGGFDIEDINQYADLAEDV